MYTSFYVSLNFTLYWLGLACLACGCVQVALAHDHFGNQCDFRRVLDEITSFSDFDLHQVCLEYPDYLADLQLSAETLYDAPKMKLLQTLVPSLVVRRLDIVSFCLSLQCFDRLKLFD